MMSKRFPLGKHDVKGVYEPSLCDQLIKQLWPFLEQQDSNLKFEQYCDKIEAWINTVDTDDRVQRAFAFSCYDFVGKGKITEEGLFKFI
jgi:Ca2+-binding EF-hand superfamily protein